MISSEYSYIRLTTREPFCIVNYAGDHSDTLRAMTVILCFLTHVKLRQLMKGRFIHANFSES